MELVNYYDNLHPAIGNVGVLTLNEIKSDAFNKKIALLGNDVDNGLFAQRLKEYGIEQKSLAELSDECIVVCTAEDFPRDKEVFFKMINEANSIGINKLYCIHEFSSGFCLGAEKVVTDRKHVFDAYEILQDDISKECFLHFLKWVSTPYHWNMDMKEDTFGISDKKRYGNSYEFDDSDLCDFWGKNVILCNSDEWKKNDKTINKCAHASSLYLFFPKDEDRIKLFEQINSSEEGFKDNYFVYRSILSNIDDISEKKFFRFSGGSPLEMPPIFKTVRSICADDFFEDCHSSIDAIVLDMGYEFTKAIHGANGIIGKYNPIIVIKGFNRADYLWDAILWSNKNFPNKKISLRRNEVENIINGYEIIIY